MAASDTSWSAADLRTLTERGWIIRRSEVSSDEALDWLQAVGLSLSKAWGGPPLSVAITGAVTHHQAATVTPLSQKAVPWHNEGLYLRYPPRGLLLWCEEPGHAGGNTLLLRGKDALPFVPDALRDRLRRSKVRVSTGVYSAQHHLVMTSPGGEEVLRFCDPAIATDCRLETLDGSDANELIDALRGALLRAPFYSHTWQKGELLVIDNRAALHARTAYAGGRILRRALVGSHLDHVSGEG